MATSKIENIDKYYRILKKAYEEEKDPTLKLELKEYLISLEETILDIEFIITDREKESIALKMFLSNTSKYADYYPFVDDFYQLLNSNAELFQKKDNTSSSFTDISISLNDMIDLVYLLFQELGGNFFQVFKRIYNEKLNQIDVCQIEEELFGIMHYLPILNKTIIRLSNNTNQIERLITLAHEEGHAVAALMNPKRYTSSNTLFREVESIFVELIGRDYFAQKTGNQIFLESQFENLAYFYQISKKILKEKEMYDDYMSLAESEKLRKENNRLLSYIQKRKSSSTSLLFDSLFSYIVAIELYEIYRIDKKESLEKLKAIIMTQSSKEEEKSIFESITPNRSLEAFKNDILIKSKKC